MQCPICDSIKCNIEYEIKTGCFDTSAFDDTIKLATCCDCGHVFEVLHPEEIDRLSVFYEEYGMLNQVACSKDQPGSDDNLSLLRYEQRLKTISPYLQKDSYILDVGCGMGGFMSFLALHGYRNICGVEPSEAFVTAAIKAGRNVLHGSAEKIPLNDSTVDFIILDQVLEHTLSPRIAICEARRVLKPDGFLLIGVPHAPSYEETEFFPFGWLIMREHLQHFSTETLAALAGKEGLGIKESSIALTAMSGSSELPTALMVFSQDIAIGQIKQSPNWITSYAKQAMEHLENLRSKIDSLESPVACWGISKEFLLLWANSNLPSKKPILFDANSRKCNVFRFAGMPILSPELLPSCGVNSVLITAPAHRHSIRQSLTKMGWDGRIEMT